MKDFIKTKGYYLILALCAVSILALGILTIHQHINQPDDPIALFPTEEPASKPIYTPKPTLAPTSSSTIKPTAKPTAAPSPTADKDVSNPIHTAAPSPTKKPELRMIMPVQGIVITDYASKKLVYNSTLGEWRTHPAMDIEAPAGSKVSAALDGNVYGVKYDPLYGLTVILDHGDGLKSIYCGFENVSVNAGDSVKTGDSLGTLGGEIYCESNLNTHLHFEISLNGKNVDPNSYFKG